MSDLENSPRVGGSVERAFILLTHAEEAPELELFCHEVHRGAFESGGSGHIGHRSGTEFEAFEIGLGGFWRKADLSEGVYHKSVNIIDDINYFILILALNKAFF